MRRPVPNPSHMKLKFLIPAAAGALLSFTACEDTSGIGGSLTEPNVAINVDSSFVITGQSFHQPDFDSRSETMLLGAVDMEGVGSYSSSIVTQLMAASSLVLPDTVPLDSISGMALKLNFKRGALTGDSLAPCQLKVYELTRQLPASIQSNFDPSGYYDPAHPIGVRNYTASILGLSEADYPKGFTTLKVDLPVEMGRKFITRYRTDPSVFQWPADFNRYFPGLYIENTFGKGCMVNVTVAEMSVYHNVKKRVPVHVGDSTVYADGVGKDSVTIFSTAPEVLSSNNLRMNIAQPIRDMVERDNKVVVMSPCGYLASIRIPAQEIIDKYYASDFDLAVVNNLVLTIPARSITNNYGLRPAPNLLLVRRCDMVSFFANNQIPDATKKSFYGSYSTSTGKYTFSSMRQYIIDLLAEGKTVKEEDMDFVLIPVDIASETNTLNNTVYVTNCLPYIYRPTLGELDFSRARLTFTFGTKH